MFSVMSSLFFFNGIHIKIWISLKENYLVVRTSHQTTKQVEQVEPPYLFLCGVRNAQKSRPSLYILSPNMANFSRLTPPPSKNYVSFPHQNLPYVRQHEWYLHNNEKIHD